MNNLFISRQKGIFPFLIDSPLICFNVYDSEGTVIATLTGQEAGTYELPTNAARVTLTTPDNETELLFKKAGSSALIEASVELGSINNVGGTKTIEFSTLDGHTISLGESSSASEIISAIDNSDSIATASQDSSGLVMFENIINCVKKDEALNTVEIIPLDINLIEYDDITDCVGSSDFIGFIQAHQPIVLPLAVCLDIPNTGTSAMFPVSLVASLEGNDFTLCQFLSNQEVVQMQWDITQPLNSKLVSSFGEVCDTVGKVLNFLLPPGCSFFNIVKDYLLMKPPAQDMTGSVPQYDDVLFGRTVYIKPKQIVEINFDEPVEIDPGVQDWFSVYGPNNLKIDYSERQQQWSPCNFKIESNVVKFSPPADGWPAFFTVEIDGSVSDDAGNKMGKDVQVKLNTIKKPEFTCPLEMTIPNRSIDLPPGQEVTLSTPVSDSAEVRLLTLAAGSGTFEVPIPDLEHATGVKTVTIQGVRFKFTPSDGGMSNVAIPLEDLFAFFSLGLNNLSGQVKIGDVLSTLDNRPTVYRATSESSLELKINGVMDSVVTLNKNNLGEALRAIGTIRCDSQYRPSSVTVEMNGQTNVIDIDYQVGVGNASFIISSSIAGDQDRIIVFAMQFVDPFTGSVVNETRTIKIDTIPQKITTVTTGVNVDY